MMIMVVTVSGLLKQMNLSLGIRLYLGTCSLHLKLQWKLDIKKSDITKYLI